ncbi:MAG: helix-turn-helix domain-containing protein [Dehalococcoidia bacterium]|jgi:cytoskeletal protein RodZ|nr:helix-turn-helix domain-containing protein [Dehalococcoidia bacterium]MDW8009024.1 helix-turn-helix domain-containing protein [Chloroflexota bacterium]
MPRLGELLEQKRLERGLSLEDVERATRIPLKYLVALEREDFSQLPPPVYARGFVRSYASYLGLNPREVLTLMPLQEEEEIRLRPLTRVERPRPLSGSAVGLVAVLAAIALALAAVVGLGREGPAALGPNSPSAQLRSGTVPQLVGKDMAQAAAELESRNLDYVLVAMDSGQAPDGRVVAQLPGPGQRASSGQPVVLVVEGR